MYTHDLTQPDFVYLYLLIGQNNVVEALENGDSAEATVQFIQKDMDLNQEALTGAQLKVKECEDRLNSGLCHRQQATSLILKDLPMAKKHITMSMSLVGSLEGKLGKHKDDRTDCEEISRAHKSLQSGRNLLSEVLKRAERDSRSQKPMLDDLEEKLRESQQTVVSCMYNAKENSNRLTLATSMSNRKKMVIDRMRRALVKMGNLEIVVRGRDGYFRMPPHLRPAKGRKATPAYFPQHSNSSNSNTNNSSCKPTPSGSPRPPRGQSYDSVNGGMDNAHSHSYGGAPQYRNSGHSPVHNGGVLVDFRDPNFVNLDQLKDRKMLENIGEDVHDRMQQLIDEGYFQDAQKLYTLQCQVLYSGLSVHSKIELVFGIHIRLNLDFVILENPISH